MLRNVRIGRISRSGSVELNPVVRKVVVAFQSHSGVEAAKSEAQLRVTTRDHASHSRVERS